MGQRRESFTAVTFGTPVFLGQFPTLPTPPGKAWASTVVAACCGDGGLSHPIPPPEVVHFHPEGDLRNQRCTADLQR